MSKHKQEIWAFWPYDLPPYFLGAKVISWNGDLANVEGYGKGATFKPVKVVEGKEGERIQTELKKIQAEFRAAKKAALKVVDSKVRALGFDTGAR